MKLRPGHVITFKNDKTEEDQFIIPIFDKAGMIGFLNMQNRRLWKPNVQLKKNHEILNYSVMEYNYGENVSLGDVTSGNVVETCLGKKDLLAIVADFTPLMTTKTKSAPLVMILLEEAPTIRQSRVISIGGIEHATVRLVKEVTLSIR